MTEDQQPAGNSVEETSSLLEDASTLLMFHNAAVNKPNEQLENKLERPAQPIPKPATTSLLPSQSVKPRSASSSRPSSTPNPAVIRSPKINSIASPGPAIAALADSDTEGGESDKSQKAIVAAAALAAAAGIPLPLINHSDQNDLNTQIIERLKTKSAESSEAILQKAQTQVSKEQLEALQERAEVIRQGLKNKTEAEGDKEESGNERKEEVKTDDLKTDEVHTPIKQDDETTIGSDSKPQDNNETDVEAKDNDDTIMRDITNDDLQNNETEEETTTILGNQEPKAEEEADEAKKHILEETEPELDQEPEEPKPKKQRKTKKKEPQTENVTVPKDYIVDPDAGIISCVCGYEDDDGFTIQCDNCFRWQHAVCMGIDSIDNAPDDYLCNVCSPRKIDVKKARAAQTQRLNALKRKKERRNRGSVDPDTQDDSNQENSSTSGKEKEQSGSQAKPKPKPKPTTAYGKNLEDDDIHVLDAKDSYKSIYYALNAYDYQDEEVYNFVQSLKNLDNPRFIKMAKSDFNKAEIPKLQVKPYSEVNNKKFNGISRLGLFTETAISQGKMIGEYLGEIGIKDKYIADTRNHYRIWGVEKPQVQFIPGLPLVIDARFSGNSTRYIRRSCNANCELQTVIVSKELVKFIIYAIKPIKPGSELTLNWNWDINHPIKGIQEGKQFDQTNDAVKPSLVLSVESILTFTECGCTSVNECSLSKVKKASAHIYRATRKGNNTSGLKLLQREAQYKSIQERLLERETSNLRDSQDQAKSSIPLPNRNGSIQEDITIRPFIYNYLSKKRRTEEIPRTSSQSLEKNNNNYLPIPIDIIPEQKKIDPSTLVENIPAKPVKKLSFADYVKKKKKPT